RHHGRLLRIRWCFQLSVRSIAAIAHSCSRIGLVFIEVDETIFIRVPFVALCFQALGHFACVQQSVVVAIIASKSFLESAVQSLSTKWTSIAFATPHSALHLFAKLLCLFTGDLPVRNVQLSGHPVESTLHHWIEVIPTNNVFAF